MKVTVVGAGAAGLCCSLIIKRQFNADVRILEKGSEAEMPGVGVALLPFSIAEVRLLDRDLYPAYAEMFIQIPRQTESFAGLSKDPKLSRVTRFQENQYAGVKRSQLLTFLKEAVKRAGIPVEYEAEVTPERVRAEKASVDLLIGGDGAGSTVRAAFADKFAPRSVEAKSRFAWLELEGDLDRFLFGYIYVAGKGLIRITAYPHAKGESSAIITHSMGLTATLDAPGMLDADGNISEQGLAQINEYFAPGLGGRRLKGASRWRRFRATNCQNATFENVALVGDSYATLFYETGWGTSVAIQSAQILGHALQREKEIGAALSLYDRKVAELNRGAIMATTKTMRDVDGQAVKFYKAGPAKFLELGVA